MYKIGIFAKMNKVTVKTLRYYEEIGLLNPCYVDQANGHRYYSAAQTYHLHRILALKSIGFSLQEIQAATRRGISHDELIAYLQGKQVELSSSIVMEQNKLKRLESYIKVLLENDYLLKNKVVVKEIISNIFIIEVPLPGNPLKALNSYLLKGPDRSLLVDTGFNSPLCKDALLAGLAKIRVDLNEVDFFITHMHGDHSGLVNNLITTNSKIYCSEVDAELINDSNTDTYAEKLINYFTMHGFPKMDVSDSQNVMEQYLSGVGLIFTFVSDGDVLSIGDYKFTCIMTPGHTPGHVCLYEPEQKILISGDHILGDVSSNITGWFDVEDSLGMYLDSLEKTKQLNINLVLPAHRSVIKDSIKRIEELQQHHERRLEEVLTILGTKAMTAYQVAPLIDWDINYTSWDKFPQLQKWCATGEAISHLEHLVKQKRVQAISRDGLILFQRII